MNELHIERVCSRTCARPLRISKSITSRSTRVLVVAPRKVAEARTYTNGEDCPVQVEHPKRHHQSGRTAGFEFLKTPRSVSLQRRRALRELG